jgi:hypothetical protein
LKKDINTMAKNKTTQSTPMTSDAAARIQSAKAKVNAGKVTKGSFAARAQSAAAKGEKR